MYQHDPQNPNSLLAGKVFALHEDRSGMIWIGMSTGLTKFDKHNHTFTHYTTANGLKSDFIVGILEDREGNLWLSSSQGIIKFDPKHERFKQFGIHNGLQGLEFIQTSYTMGPDGQMFFGGPNGFNAFYPEKIKGNSYIPPIALTDLELFNQSVPIGGDSPLQQAIWETEQLTLDYDDYVFSLEFAALSYAVPQKNHYRYKLEGFDETWNEVDSSRRIATYTNLDPGQYTLRILGSNNDEIGMKKERRLTLQSRLPGGKHGGLEVYFYC